jgi:hypothetical protein
MSAQSKRLFANRMHLSTLLLFAVLSVADFIMTWQLLKLTDGQVYESNPVANAWFESFGWIGLGVYKALAIVLVVGCALFVTRYRPHAGRRILAFACAATTFVVVYSCYLAYASDIAPSADQDDPYAAEMRSRLLDREMHRQRKYHTLLAQLSIDLIEGRCGLAEAVAALRQNDKANDPQWLTILQRNYPNRTPEECLAIHLGYHALVKVHQDEPLAFDTATQLGRDFREMFGRPYQFDVAAFMTQPRLSAPGYSGLNLSSDRAVGASNLVRLAATSQAD